MLGVVSTNALELGIDIGHLDVAVLAGYPGTIASMWQQAGRAGPAERARRRRCWWPPARPMDQYLAAHPDYLFGAPPEHARINPENPFILVNHLKCAAFELPFARGRGLRRRRVGATWPRSRRRACSTGRAAATTGRSETYPADHISLRTVTADNFLVIDTTARDAGRGRKRRQIIAEVDWRSAFAMVYPKAIYMVEGEPFEVQELHFREDEEKVAYVKRVRWTTSPTRSAPRACGSSSASRHGRRRRAGLAAEQGEVLVAEKVVGLQEDQDGHAGERRARARSSCRSRRCRPPALWLTLRPEAARRDLAAPRRRWSTGCAGLTYLLHHLAPIFLLCDMRDVGSWLGDAARPVARRRAGRVV